MWALGKALGNASAKLAATFFMVIFLMLLGLVFFPTQLNQLNDFANIVANWEAIRNPDIPEQGKFLFRTLVNESTVFGILTTLIARAVVEMLFFVLGMMWRAANPESESADSKAQSSAKTDPAYPLTPREAAPKADTSSKPVIEPKPTAAD